MSRLDSRTDKRTLSHRTLSVESADQALPMIIWLVVQSFNFNVTDQ
jgi:hypothetical protein